MLDPLSVKIPLSTGAAVRPAHPPRKLLSRSPSHPDDYIMEWDYSSLSNFMICPRKAENYSVRGREACYDQSAQSFGGLFHKLDEKRLLMGFTEEFGREKAQLISDHFVLHPPSPTDHRTQQMMESVMKGYESRYKTDGLGQKLVHFEGKPFVERPFKIELMTVEVNTRVLYPTELLLTDTSGLFNEQKEGGLYVRNLHIFYTGRIDSLLLDSNLYWVMDDKTSSRGGQEFEEAFRLSLQTRGYCWAAQKLLGKPIAGLLLNAVIVRKPTATGKGTEYNRRSYFYSPDSLDEWEDNVKAHIHDFIGCLVRGFFPQVSLSFKSPCPSCDYHENCALSRKQRAADLASDIYRDVVWNPMLE